MEGNEHGSSYFMEVYDQIRSVDLILRGEDNPKKLELHPQQIVAKQFEGPDNVYPLVVSIEPESFTNVQKHANEGVGIRLQLRDDTPEPQSSFISTAVKRVGSEINKLEQSISQCGCKTCGLFLFVDDVKFNRVLPLPSQTWRDLFNNWSCCSHGNATPGYVTKAPLKPREGDCLLDDYSILVRTNIIESRNILIRQMVDKSTEKDAKEVKCVKCSRCRANLGEALIYEKKIETIKLTKSNIEVFALKLNPPDTLPRPIFFSEFFLERVLAQQLANTVHSQSSHLFVIQDTEGNIYLLVRVLNTTSRLFISNGKPYIENECSQSDSQKLSRTLESGEGNHKVAQASDTAVVNSNGSGDHSDKNKKDSEAARKEGIFGNSKQTVNGRPWQKEGKVADVIEKLFSFSTHLISIGRTSGDVHGGDNSGCERIVKVLYAATFDKKSRNKIGLKWLKDDRSVTLSYPKHICIQISLILVASSLTMPLSHRVVGDFVSGFLRLD